MNKIFYFYGKQTVIDILSYKLFINKKIDKELNDLIEVFKHKVLPVMPISAEILMTKYSIPEGKLLGNKLKMIEEEWINNDFYLSDEQIHKILNH